MYKRQYKVFLVGLGRMGLVGFDEVSTIPNKYTHFGYLTSDERFQLVGAWDIDQSKCLEVKKLSNRILEITDKIETVNADVFVIATPESTHLPLIRRIVKNKMAKTIVCEKPVGLSESELVEIEHELTNTTISFFVNYPRSLSLENSEVFVKLREELLDDQRVYVSAWISNSDSSAAWHLMNLLTVLFVEARNLSFENVKGKTQETTQILVGRFGKLTVQLNFIDLSTPPFADVLIYSSNSTYFFVDGFTKLYRSSKELRFGWRSVSNNLNGEIDLMNNGMPHLYNRVFNSHIGDKPRIECITRAKETHALVSRLENARNAN